MFPHNAKSAENIIDKKGKNEAAIIKGEIAINIPNINVLLILI